MENCEKKRLSGQRPKKRRFQGNKFLKKTISGESKKKKTNFVRKAPNDSASYRKLPSEKYLLDSPKTIGSSITITRIAAFLAVCDHNDGHKSQIDIINAMGLKYNKNNVITAKDSDKKRLSTAFKRVTAASLESRKNKRLKLAKENMKFKLSEGCAYDPEAY
ncbi:hypothetical protein TNIN_319481 [Trichonephila inaurata madagascariensis]|uniref:Uncharacterized protein n=1 Tax=Trichonephila inaurata madagascariensis TaxID=2747483 RepID=A0A8X6WSE4_9ARAC|nr:hypothetical protein TNIN_319481 [Trichonephila inaurata madagascariensis]